ncbi:MAG: TIGR00270 family protein [Nanoarchaeota archaeon]|nr:TIGR00270 family protein [Nanoarchaeota archaeon]
MPNCDMCGKVTDQLIFASVEGTELSVCSGCSQYGKIIKKKRPVSMGQKRNTARLPDKEVVNMVVSDYSAIIRNKRESLGLKQKEIALKLAERESLIQKIETGQIKPSLKLSEKLEKILGVILIEKVELEKVHTSEKTKTQGLTIGDMIKIK